MWNNENSISAKAIATHAPICTRYPALLDSGNDAMTALDTISKASIERTSHFFNFCVFLLPHRYGIRDIVLQAPVADDRAKRLRTIASSRCAANPTPDSLSLQYQARAFLIQRAALGTGPSLTSQAQRT